MRDGIRVSCRRGLTVDVGNKAVSSAKLSIGDSFAIGDNRITLLEAPGGFDVALQIEFEQDVDASTFEGAFRTDLRQGWFSPRPAAWILSLAVIVLGFAVPWLLASYTADDAAIRSFLPDDALWTSGPLHDAHELAAGDNCRACHVEFFQRVQDTACLDCHTTIQDHVAMDATGAGANAEPAPRCATCHREHNEPDPHLIISADALCTDCHASPDSAEMTAGTAPVSGFSLEDHPAFEADLLLPSARRAGTGLVFRVDYGKCPRRRCCRGLEPEVSTRNAPRPATRHRPAHRRGTGLRRLPSPVAGSRTFCAGDHGTNLRWLPRTHVRSAGAGPAVTARPAVEVMLTLEGQYLRKFSDPGVPQEAVGASPHSRP